MIRTDPKQTEFVDFYLPFNGRLKASNRCVKRAAMVPWDEVEFVLCGSFAGTGQGSPAKSGRIAYGALLIKEQSASRTRDGRADHGDAFDLSPILPGPA